MSKQCHIYIYGDIVNLQSKNIASEGAVSLTSVKNAYDKSGDPSEIIVHIHSNGGSVFEGFAIHDFLVNTGKDVTTIIEGLCCSIATVIFMAGTKRMITENARFLIHNPWGNGEGDAAYFRNYANELQQEQARLLDFYKKHTGANKATLQKYMNAETLMPPTLAVELKFATGIIDTVKAMAMYRNSTHTQLIINNKKEMDKKKASKLDSLIAGLKSLLKDFKNEKTDAKAATKSLADDAGDVYFDGELSEGTAVFEDAAMTTPCEDGDYQFEDGTEITVASGVVTVVTDGAEDSNDLESLKAKLAALEADKLELENKLDESTAVMASATKALTLAKSTYKPEKRENRFKRINQKEGDDDDMKAKMEERRASYKGKNKK